MWRLLTVAESRKALPSHIQHLSRGFQSSTSTFRGVFSTASWYSFHFRLPINSSATLSRPTTIGTWTQLLKFCTWGQEATGDDIFVCAGRNPSQNGMSTPNLPSCSCCCNQFTQHLVHLLFNFHTVFTSRILRWVMAEAVTYVLCRWQVGPGCSSQAARPPEPADASLNTEHKSAAICTKHMHRQLHYASAYTF